MKLTLRSRILYGSENKERLSPYVALTDWFYIIEVESVYRAVRSESLYRAFHNVLRDYKH